MAEGAEAAARERSRVTWDAMAAGWDRRRDDIWSESRQVGEWLVRQLAPQPGDTVLELAAGVGDTGFIAARRIGAEGRLISTDFAPEMVAAARRRAAEQGITNATFQVLDAEQMDLPSDSVDGVLCRWGYMLMVNPAAAFAETRRVLRLGGKLAFAVWSTAEANPWASLPGRILVSRGHMAPPDPKAPGIFALSDRERLRALVTEAGFAAPHFEEVASHKRFASFDAYWGYLTELAGAISPVLRGLSSDERQAVREQLREAAAPFAVESGYDLPGRCLNAVTS
jgi:ubiquinone/menaquinone biosynthesis C-methylase UbiE